MVWKRRKNVEIRGISSWIASSSDNELWSCVKHMDGQPFAHDADLENATKSAETMRSIVDVRDNVMAWKSFPCHQCLLMIPIKGNLMSLMSQTWNVGFEHALGVLWTILKTCSTVSDTTRAARRVWWQVEQGFKIVNKTTRNVQTPFWYDKSWGK